MPPVRQPAYKEKAIPPHGDQNQPQEPRQSLRRRRSLAAAIPALLGLGGAEHVMIDFPTEVLEKLVIGDRIQVRAFGVGLAIEGFPDVLCTGLDPDLFEKWITKTKDGKLEVPVAKMAPAAIMGSGLGRD